MVLELVRSWAVVVSINTALEIFFTHLDRIPTIVLFRSHVVAAMVMDYVQIAQENGWTSRIPSCSSHSLTSSHYYCPNGHGGTFSSDHH